MFVLLLQGTWVVLLNAHYAPRLLDMLDSIITDCKNLEGNFRLWISAKISYPLPSSLLLLAVKVVADSPKVFWGPLNNQDSQTPAVFLM